jgi:hypothetical protein
MQIHKFQRKVTLVPRVLLGLACLSEYKCFLRTKELENNNEEQSQESGGLELGY